MKESRKWQDMAIGLCLFLTVGSVIAATTVYVKNPKEPQGSKQKPQTYRAELVQDLPAVVSKVKGLEITGVSLVGQNTPTAALEINVTNNRDEAVMAIDFVSGKGTYSGLREDGLLEECNPRIIIPPHALRTFTWSLGEIIAGADVRLAAAIFDNGKEEGDVQFVKGIKLSRQSFQKQKRDERRKAGGE